MNILITGGTGYLGGRLAQFLFTHGHTIFLGSRQKKPSPDWLPQAHMVQTLWDSSGALERICHHMDVVVHAAGMNAEDCAYDPVGALAFNGVCTSRLLQAAIQTNVPRFIYASTAHVYHSPLIGTCTESTNPTNLHPYATSHRAGEDVVLRASQEKKINGIVFRLSNAYGAPAESKAKCWNLLVNDLCHQAVTSGQMILHSSGMQRRDFVALTDVCRAIEHLIVLPKQQMNTSLFNIGGQWAPTVWEMACLLQERCETTLGFRPKLSRVLPCDREQSIEFEYRLDAMEQIGFNVDVKPSQEIDRLLTFCHEKFVTLEVDYHQ